MLPTKRIASLDGIRAIAVTCVLIDHFGMGLGKGDRLDLGGFGVRIFFVLSGFLITGLLLREIEQAGRVNLAQFFYRRTLRIFPPFYFYLAVMGMLGAAGVIALRPSDIPSAALYMSNYVGVSLTAKWTLGHLWSLATEEQFYLIWPVALVLLGRKRAPLMLAGVVAGLPLLRVFLWNSGAHVEVIAHVFHLSADHLATGCLLAFLAPQLHASAKYMAVIRSPWVVLLPLAAFLLNIPTKFNGLHDTVLFTALNILIALSIDAAIVNAGSVVGRVLNWRPVMTVGAMSYSLYLWQQPFTMLGRPIGTFARYGIAHNPFFALGMTILCAAFSYTVVEKLSRRRRAADYQVPREVVEAHLAAN